MHSLHDETSELSAGQKPSSAGPGCFTCSTMTQCWSFHEKKTPFAFFFIAQQHWLGLKKKKYNKASKVVNARICSCVLMLFHGSTEACWSFHLKTNIAVLISDGAGDVMCWRAIRSYCGWQWGNHFEKKKKEKRPTSVMEESAHSCFCARCHTRNLHHSQVLLSETQQSYFCLFVANAW